MYVFLKEVKSPNTFQADLRKENSKEITPSGGNGYTAIAATALIDSQIL